MLIRQFTYLVALAKERHFGRAAAACNISQPSLSAAIKQLEEELGVPIVERGHRYTGLTAEGEQILSTAKRVLHETEIMRQMLSGFRGGLGGKLRIGAIPTALTLVPGLTAEFSARYPCVTFEINSLTSEEIQQRIDDFTLDAGITYLDNEPLQRVIAKPMHHQTFRLLARKDSDLGARTDISWKEAADLNLCLLTPNMQNRRIIDGVFRTIGRAPKAVVETNSILILCAHATMAGFASIVPSQIVQSFAMPANTVAIDLVKPAISRSIGLIISDRQPSRPLAQILFDMTKPVEMDR